MVRVRPLFSLDDYVCDLKFIMRARLLLGLYNNMYTPKKLQMWTRLYCLIITVISMYFMIDFCVTVATGLFFYYHIIRLLLISANMLVSLYTADSYVINCCTRVNLTDSTLTSAPEFSKVERIMKYVFGILVLMKAIAVFNYLATTPSLWIYVFQRIPVIFIDLGMDMRVINQFSVFGLMFTRITILRKKLERLGFRHVRNAKFGLNVYSEMYFRTMQKMNDTTTPMKVLMAFDLLYYSTGIIFLVCEMLHTGLHEQSFDTMCFFIETTAKIIIIMFLNGFIVKSTAVEVDKIQTLVVDELIESPVEVERRAMYSLLKLISALPVRVSLFRTVDVDVALALTVLATCTQHIVLIIQTFN